MTPWTGEKKIYIYMYIYIERERERKREREVNVKMLVKKTNILRENKEKKVILTKYTSNSVSFLTFPFFSSM